MSGGIYLDYAATSAIRPPEVAEAMARYLRDVGATPGRSGHARALAAGRVALHTRRRLAELFGIPGDPGRIAFQLNATHALNTALFGILSPGDLVVRTTFDHNAVRRPVAALALRGVREAVLPLDVRGGFERERLRELIRGARLFVLPHASNVTGVLFPVAEMAALAREHGVTVLLDAAQTAGHYPVDVEALGVDLLAFTGHKGLLGPQGIGGLWVREGVEVAPLLHGGTGGESTSPDMPAAYPDHLEAGTQNAPGMAGLAAALDWVAGRTVAALHAREIALKRKLEMALQAIPGVTLCSPADAEAVGIVTLLVEGMDPAELAGVMDRRFGIQGRAGLHCAPDAHQALGTIATGAFRLSLGWATTEAEIDATASAFRKLIDDGRKG